jgi:hypothetical protein
MEQTVYTGVISFNQRLYQFLKEKTTVDIHIIEKSLSAIRGEIIKEMNFNDEEKKCFRSVINAWSAFIVDQAQSLRNSPHVKTSLLLNGLFQGEKIIGTGDDYLIIKDENGSEHLHMIVDSIDEKTDDTIGKKIASLQSNEGIIGAYLFLLDSREIIFKDIVTLLKATINMGAVQENPPMKTSIPEEPQLISASPKELCAIGVPSTTAVSKADQYIGKLVNDDQRKYSFDSKGGFLQGFFYSKIKDLPLKSSTYFIAEKDNIKLVLLLEKGNYSKRTIVGQEQSFSEMSTPVIFKTIKKVVFNENGDVTYCGLVPRGEYSEFQVRYFTIEDYPLLNFAKEGTQLGFIDDRPEVSLPLYLPMEKEFLSIFISGVMGSGKTNAIMYLIRTLNAKKESPAIVIFDPEGEYVKLQKEISANIEDELLKKGINLNYVLPIVYKKLSLDSDGNATIPLNEIGGLDIPTLLPPMRAQTLNTFMHFAERARCELLKEGNVNMNSLLKKIEEYVISQVTNFSVRETIIRNCRTSNFGIFDQSDKEPIYTRDLCKPGQITIIDISDLHTDHRRIAILAILTMINAYKDTNKDRLNGVMVFIDEAHHLFPASKNGQVKKDDIDRISRKLDYICRQGRKRRYGLVLATQSINDINPEVSSLCSTQIIMNNSGRVPTWLRLRMNGIHPTEINNLPTGTAYVILPGISTPQRILIPRVVD